ncbi:MAG: NAD-dependent epimerase/dehydratase family protein, partial [Acidimicrobiales bacterium]
MRIAVTGTHGLIGRHLIPELERAGHRVVRLVRGRADNQDTVSWDPDRCLLDPADLGGVDAAVHLAGAGIFGRWNDSRKRAMLDSRVRGTLLLAERLAQIDPPPQVLVSGSAVGWYGDRGDELLTEQSAPGSGFLAELCAQWEAAAQAAVDAGIRTVFARTGIVQATDGGALATQLPVFKLGLG